MSVQWIMLNLFLQPLQQVTLAVTSESEAPVCLALFEDSSGGTGEVQCLEHSFMPDVDCLSTSVVAKQGVSYLLLVHDADFSGAGGAFKLTATVGSSAQVSKSP